MIIAIVFLGISFLVLFGISRGLVREKTVLATLVSLYAASLVSTFLIPYILDDLDFLQTLSLAMDSGSVLRWFFAPHNEHVIPAVKLLYYLFY